MAAVAAILAYSRGHCLDSDKVQVQNLNAVVVEPVNELGTQDVVLRTISGD